MKSFLKTAILVFFFSNAFFAMAQVSGGAFTLGVPDVFGGVWEREDRFVMFAEDSRFLESSVQAVLSDQNASDEEKKAARGQVEYVSILLKTFYGWYLDRTAEPASFAAAQARVLNDSTCPEAEHIRVDYRPLLHGDVFQQGDASAWELFVWYPGLKDAVIVPVAIIGGNLYLNFAIKLNMERSDEVAQSRIVEEAAADDGILGFWCSFAPTDGIKASVSANGDNIYSTYITPDAVYNIRYWRTDMDYTNESAFFSDGGQTFSVVKHIQSGGKIFTCTNGRSVTIRNIQKSNSRPTAYELDSASRVCGFGEPYLKRVQTANTMQAVATLVENAMSRRAPNPNPPFPPSNLDFHIEEIRRLEEGNLTIQSLRDRNRNWGILQND